MKNKKIIGIDPGTKSFDILGIEFNKNKENIFLDKTIPSEQVAMNPEILLSEIKPHLPVDAIIGPSGYGLPVTKLADAGDKELNQMLPIEGSPRTFSQNKIVGVDVENLNFKITKEKERGKHTGGVSVNEGIKRLFRKMKEMKLPVYFTPGVIHLTTVPEFRKLNHMDMGTADKLCCVALAIKDQSKRLKIPANKTSFILLEMGFGFSSAMAIYNGQVVDGLGGTLGFPGFLGTGHLDGELAIRMGKSPQGVLFTGGALSIAQSPIKDIKELPKHKQVFSLLIESALKDIACMLVCHPKPKEIILSGRLCREKVIVKELTRQIKKNFTNITIKQVKRSAKISKEAAEGAIILGAGLLRLKYTDIFNSLMIKQAKGTMYDYIRISNIKNQISK